MIRFLQTPGKVKKIVLGGLLVVICGAMAITLIPGGILGDAFGFLLARLARCRLHPRGPA